MKGKEIDVRAGLFLSVMIRGKLQILLGSFVPTCKPILGSLLYHCLSDSYFVDENGMSFFRVVQSHSIHLEIID